MNEVMTCLVRIFHDCALRIAPRTAPGSESQVEEKNPIWKKLEQLKPLWKFQARSGIR
jgi:hypothetical protein